MTNLDGTVGAAVAEAAWRGWCRVPDAVSPADRAAVLDEVEGVAWQDLEPKVGNVTQAGQVFLTVVPTPDLPTASALAGQVTNAITGSGVAGTEGFAVNEAAAQRQHPGDGISWHRDQSAYGVVVAILTLDGEARFELEGGDAWLTTPGDLVLLRGPGLGAAGPADRPRHRILGPERGTRTTLTLRQNGQNPGTWPD